MAQELTFDYIPIPRKDPKTQKIVGETYFPFIPIQLHFKEAVRSFYALVDSGAERNLFPAELGELIGIKIKMGKLASIFGIGQHEIEGYTHVVNLSLGRITNFNTEVDFSFEQNVPLLGRNGFFDFFRSVSFRERRKIIELRL